MKLTKIILSLLLVFSAAVHAEEETVDINFRDLNVRDFIEMVSKITQKNMLIETELTGKINFISAKPVKKSALFALANSILEGKGLTIVDLGEYYKVVKVNAAPGEGLEVSNSIEGETMKTVIFPLRNTDANVLRAKIKPMLNKDAEVIAFKENNVMAVTAKPRSLHSLSKLIEAVELRGEKKSVVMKLENSSVKEMFANIQQMAQKIFPKGIESETVDLFKDESTNSVILVGKQENIDRMIDYIKQLDIKGESTAQKMYVVSLKNSNVEEMEKIMSQLISQMNNEAIKQAPKGQETSKALVVSDIERNALVVLATAEQMKNIKETIAKIDIPQAQVYVKARIIEINTDLTEQLGMRYGFEGGAITSSGLFSAAANAGASSLMVSPTLMTFLNNQTYHEGYNGGPGYTTTDRSFAFDSNISKIFALGAKLDLLKQNGAAHILSEPSVLCTNNKEATIQVGQTQSILTQAQQTTQGQGNIINNYSREDIGITLKVKPRLSSNNQVTLEVEAEIEDILPGSSAASDRPTTTKRKVTTNAIVNNGETIILGGLMKSAAGKGDV
ncbi:MAG: type secretion system secretin GspD, partial [Pseudomonadota bacterium]